MKITQSLFDAAFNNSEVRWPDDCDRICRVAAGMGISMTPSQANDVWELWSDSKCAGWLIIHDDDEIQRAIRSFVRERLGIDEL